jgi:nicotinic acid mononucleotide adenylyltransferase
LRQAHPEDDFSLVVGADTLEQVQLWHRWEDISREFTPIVVGRQGHPAVEGAPCFPDISSSEVRDLLGSGRAVDHLVPAVLVEHLAALYGPDAP